MNKYDVRAAISEYAVFSVEAKSREEAERLIENIGILISVQPETIDGKILDYEIQSKTKFEAKNVELVKEPGDPDDWSYEIGCSICGNYEANLIDKTEDEFVFECSWCGESFKIKKDDFIQRL